MSTSRDPLPGEIQYKVWLDETAAKLGIKTNSLAMRIKRGKFQAPPRRVVNCRIIYVTP